MSDSTRGGLNVGFALFGGLPRYLPSNCLTHDAATHWPLLTLICFRNSECLICRSGATAQLGIIGCRSPLSAFLLFFKLPLIKAGCVSAHFHPPESWIIQIKTFSLQKPRSRPVSHLPLVTVMLDGVKKRRRLLCASSIGVSFLDFRFFISSASWTERNFPFARFLTFQKCRECQVVRSVPSLTSRLQGLEADLGMTGNDYNIALCLFFATSLPSICPS